MFIRKDEMLEHHDSSSYIQPFSKELWLAIIISILIIEICTSVLVYFKISTRKFSAFGFVSALFHPLETLMNQGE